ncbi:hypothetical protein AAMO2058_000386000 [Amorphochlora amoebiformis]
MEPELSKKFPEIRTFHGKAVNATLSGEFDFTHQGFHGQIFCPRRGLIYVDPFSRKKIDLYSIYSHRENKHLVKNKRSFGITHSDHHDHSGEHKVTLSALTDTINAPTSSKIHSYRLAISANGEYSQYHGNTYTSVQSAIVTAVNRVNGIFKRESSITMTLIGSNSDLICLQPCPSLGNDATSLINNIQTYTDTKVSKSSYDIGHVFSTGGGGLAGYGVVCSRFGKAEGVTGSSRPENDAFWVDYVAHEIGHQFHGAHTFNGALGACAGGNRAQSYAYEPGSGSTIMAYAGICGTDNIQTNSDPYFHLSSLDQFEKFVTTGYGGLCGTHNTHVNAIPTVVAGTSTLNIPRSQPFVLDIVSSTDADPENLYHQWEQIDLAGQRQINNPAGTGSPRFRSRAPTLETHRYFPELADIMSGTSNLDEQLPTSSGTMNFAVIARDHYSRTNDVGYGTWGVDKMTVNVMDSGPLTVSTPSAVTIWAGGASVTVNWAPAGTSSASSTVDILVSTDNGANWAHTLVSGTNNDGSQVVTAPCLPITSGLTKAVLMIRSPPVNGNYWFALSPSFTISPSPACQTTNMPSTSYPTYYPTFKPTSPTAATVIINPTSYPTGTPAPTAQRVRKVELKVDFADADYSTLVSNPINRAAFTTALQNRLILKAWGISGRPLSRVDLQSNSYTNRAVIRSLQPLHNGGSIGVKLEAHVDFFDGEGIQQASFLTLASATNSVLFNASDSWSHPGAGDGRVTYAELDIISAPPGFCINPIFNCHYVIWETWHSSFETYLKIEPGDQVIFYWTGDESLHKLSTASDFKNCNFEGSTKLTTTQDETNKNYIFSAPNSTEVPEGGVDYYIAANYSDNYPGIGSLCAHDLKIQLHIEKGSSSSGSSGDGTDPSVIAAVVCAMIAVVVVTALIWYCCCRSPKPTRASRYQKKPVSANSPTAKSNPHAISISHYPASNLGSPSALPPGWTMHYSKDGVPYYYNSAMNESRWERPVMAVA